MTSSQKPMLEARDTAQLANEFNIHLMKLYGVAALMAECHKSLDALIPTQRDGLFAVLFDLASEAHKTYSETLMDCAIEGAKRRV